MTSPTPNLAEDEQTLRIAKLSCEIEQLRAAHGWNTGVGRWLPVLTALIPTVALLLALLQFTAQQSASRRQLVQKTEADSIASERAFMTPVLARQLTLYVEATSAAAAIASSESASERAKAKEDFWRLYWGPLVMFESPAVSGAMKDIGTCLPKEGQQCTTDSLRNLSLVLASALQEDYFSSWRLSPAQYAQRSINYAQARDTR